MRPSPRPARPSRYPSLSCLRVSLRALSVEPVTIPIPNTATIAAKPAAPTARSFWASSTSATFIIPELRTITNVPQKSTRRIRSPSRKRSPSRAPPTSDSSASSRSGAEASFTRESSSALPANAAALTASSSDVPPATIRAAATRRAEHHPAVLHGTPQRVRGQPALRLDGGRDQPEDRGAEDGRAEAGEQRADQQRHGAGEHQHPEQRGGAQRVGGHGAAQAVAPVEPGADHGAQHHRGQHVREQHQAGRPGRAEPVVGHDHDPDVGGGRAERALPEREEEPPRPRLLPPQRDERLHARRKVGAAAAVPDRICVYLKGDCPRLSSADHAGAHPVVRAGAAGPQAGGERGPARPWTPGRRAACEPPRPCQVESSIW